jgi:hypothetical protein
MGSLKDMWNQVDALAEKARLAIPVWCVWETENPDAGYTLFRAPTEEEAIAKFKDEDMNGEWPADVGVSCRPATPEQIKEQQEMEAGWGSPPGPVSPRRKMERI